MLMHCLDCKAIFDQDDVIRIKDLVEFWGDKSIPLVSLECPCCNSGDIIYENEDGFPCCGAYDSDVCKCIGGGNDCDN